jgi:hypothetical protein
MKFISVLIIAIAVFTAACATDPAKPPVVVKATPTIPPVTLDDGHGHADGADAPRISLADAKKDFDAGTAVFIDTHAPEQYAEQHIPGSINVPANNMDPHLNKIPKGKKIIAYCS